jgi:hypothetical protein
MWEEASRAAASNPIELDKLRELNSEVSRLQHLYYAEERYIQELEHELEEADYGPYSEAYRFQQLFYAEKRYLHSLLQSTYVSVQDLLQTVTDSSL